LNQIICQFTPAFLAVALIQRFRKKQFDTREFITAYAILTGLINTMSFFLLSYLTPRDQHHVDVTLFSVNITFKFLALSFAPAFLLALMYRAFLLVASVVHIELSARPAAKKQVSKDE